MNGLFAVLCFYIIIFFVIKIVCIMFQCYSQEESKIKPISFLS